LGAGSFTMCWSRSRIDIVIPPPPNETPFDFFDLSFFRGGAGGSG
jgi:hypothetical protein